MFCTPILPCEESRVSGLPHDLFLESPKRVPALAIERRHVDIENPKEAVCLVLKPRRLSVLKSRHALCDAERRVAGLELQNAGRDVGPLLQNVRKIRLAPKNLPRAGEKHKEARGDELLERPAPAKPVAAKQVALIRDDRDIAQVPITDARERVVAEHGVDRLGQLRAARLVDAAGITGSSRIRSCAGFDPSS